MQKTLDSQGLEYAMSLLFAHSRPWDLHLHIAGGSF